MNISLIATYPFHTYEIRAAQPVPPVIQSVLEDLGWNATLRGEAIHYAKLGHGHQRAWTPGDRLKNLRELRAAFDALGLSIPEMVREGQELRSEITGDVAFADL